MITAKSSCAKSAEGSGEEKRMSEYIVRETGYPGAIKQEIVGELVRCKDCRWREQEEPGMVYCPNVMGNWVEDEWFCADAERREDDG